jgi:hypothetical protein
MARKSLTDVLEKCVKACGEEVVEKTLSALLAEKQENQNVLTIIANSGIHKIPSHYCRGEVYSASHGNWNISSEEDLKEEFRRILRDLGTKLASRQWSRIYLVPTGHPALSAQIKLFVYRITRVSTIDLVYFNGHYYEIELDHREIVLSGQQNG